ncbi:MAG: hypothetical protein Kow0060_18540 [Methylohalobius crimeensis]
MSKRDEYVAKLKAQLDEWNADLDHLEVQANLGKEDLKQEYQEQLAHMRKKRDEIRHKLTDLQQSSETAWEHLRSGIDSAGDALQEALKKAKASFE